MEEYISDNHIEDIVREPGYEEAFLGVAFKSGTPIAIYDYDMCIQILMRDQGMSENESIDYFDFNISNAVVPNGPLFLNFNPVLFKRVKTTRISHLDPYFSGKIKNCPEDAPQPTDDWLGL